MKTVYMAYFSRLVCGCDKAFSCPASLDLEVRELADIIKALEDYPCLALTDIRSIQTI